MKCFDILNKRIKILNLFQQTARHSFSLNYQQREQAYAQQQALPRSTHQTQQRNQTQQ